MRTVQWVIRGRVQGVGFRYFVRDRAENLQVAGTVKNNPDGSVTVVGKAPDVILARFQSEILKGNGYSHIDSLTETELSTEFLLHSFMIIR